MKKINYFFHLFAVLGTGSLLFSCRPTYLGAALNGNDMSYWAKPVSQDSAKLSATYASGGLVSNGGFQGQDRMLMAQSSVYRSHTSQFTNFNYGALLYGGSYSVGTSRLPLDKFNGEYGFYGYGLRSSFNINVPSKIVDFRIIGLDMAYSKEMGSFSNLRTNVPNYPSKADTLGNNGYNYNDFIPIRSPDMFTWGFTSELAFKGNNNQQLILRYFLGRSENGYERIYRNRFFHLGNITLAYQNNRFTSFGQLAQLFTRPTINFGLSYRVGKVKIRR